MLNALVADDRLSVRHADRARSTLHGQTSGPWASFGSSKAALRGGGHQDAKLAAGRWREADPKGRRGPRLVNAY